MTQRPRVSVVVPSRNERRRLPEVLAAIEAQTLRPDEVIIADGMSQDGSREWLAAAARQRPWLTAVDNSKRSVPAALNVALRRATGDLVARMDTHADYPPDYLDTLVRLLQEQEGLTGVGGAMHSAGSSEWPKAIAAVLRHPIGMGGARHRVGGAAGPIDHVFTGCYRRSALLAVGGFDERLLANEDFELDTRLRARGGTLWLQPAARSTWHVRDSVPALARQMFRYGYYKALTLRLHPRSLKLRQLAPPLLVLGLVGAACYRTRLGGLALAGYLTLAGGVGARVAATGGASAWRGAVIPPVVHLMWACGLITGLVRFARPPLSPAPAMPEEARHGRWPE